MMRRSRLIFSILFLCLFALNFFFYGDMLAELPVLRGTKVPKNMFWAFRIQLLNLFSFMAIVILGNSLLRREDIASRYTVCTVLELTVFLKAVLEFGSQFHEGRPEKIILIMIGILYLILNFPVLKVLLWVP